MVKVLVKHLGRTLELDLDRTQPLGTFKAQLYSLTNVPPQRQTLMGFKPPVKDDDTVMSTVPVAEGQKLMLVGTPEESALRGPKEATVFMEDLTADQRHHLLLEKKIDPLPFGLVNMGTTCYLNSVVQCLRALPEVADIVRGLKGDVLSPSADVKLAASFRNLFTMMDRALEPITPVAVVSTLREAYPQFASKNQEDGSILQQDSEECLQCLFDTFKRCEAKPGRLEHLFGIEFEAMTTCLEEEGEEASVTTEVQLKLPCHMGTQLKAVDRVDQGIDLGLSEELEKRSPLLGRDALFKKSRRITRLPKYLILHFVRFEWKASHALARTQAGRAKVLRKVQFGHVLDVFDFCTEDLQGKLRLGRAVDHRQRQIKAASRNAPGAADAKGENDEDDGGNSISTSEAQSYMTGYFDLESVVTHRGRSADSGHYVGWVRKDGSDTWRKFDDETVTEHQWKDLDLAGGRGDDHIASICVFKRRAVRASHAETDAVKADPAAAPDLGAGAVEMDE